VQLLPLGLAPTIGSAYREACDTGEDPGVSKVREVSIGPRRVVWSFRRLDHEERSPPLRLPWGADERSDRRKASSQEVAACCAGTQDEARLRVDPSTRAAFSVTDCAILDGLLRDAGHRAGSFLSRRYALELLDDLGVRTADLAELRHERRPVDRH
jgi:hypothetical protein